MNGKCSYNSYKLPDRSVILYDGDCGFCNRTMIFFAEKDKKNNFIFVSSSSDFGKYLLREYRIENLEKMTLILLNPDKNTLFTKSVAVRKILSKIRYYKWIAYIMLLIPKTISDQLYDFISKNRKSIANSDSCKISNLKIKDKFIN